MFSGHGNGDPYEGMKDPGNAGNIPPDGADVSDVDPDQGAGTTLVLRCEAQGNSAAVSQIWVVKSLNSSDHYLIATFLDANNQIREKAILWSETSAFGERSLLWSLDADLEVTYIEIQPTSANLTIREPKTSQKTLSFQCLQ